MWGEYEWIWEQYPHPPSRFSQPRMNNMVYDDHNKYWNRFLVPRGKGTEIIIEYIDYNKKKNGSIKFSDHVWWSFEWNGW